MARPLPIKGPKVISRTIGVQASIRKLKTNKRKLEKGTEQGVKSALVFLQKESRKVTPKKRGVLRRSIQYRTKGKGFKTTGYLYCDSSAPHAIYVHEDLTKWHAPGTYAKFIQRTVWRHRATTSKIIRDRAMKELR